MQWKILHRRHKSMPPRVSVQEKCMYEIFNNRKGESNLGRTILKTHSVFNKLLSSKKVFLESSHYIETNIDVVVEVLRSISVST